MKDLIESKNAALCMRLLDESKEKIVLDAIAPFKGDVLKSNLIADSTDALIEVVGID